MFNISLTQLSDTTQTLDTVSVNQEIQSLSSMSLDEFLNQLIRSSVKFAINLAIAILVFYIGKFIITRLYRFVESIMIRRKIDPSLSTFILSTVKIILYFILIVTVIGILGIETSSFLALFASAGVAIGMALSGTLQNFAGGVLILLLKPYKVGDYIEAQGYAGTVTEIQIFHTLISTPDNKAIIIPNGGLSTSSINNWSQRGYRRLSWNIAISYGDNVASARKAILDIFRSDPRIIKVSPNNHKADMMVDNTAAQTAQTNDFEEESLKPGLIYRLFHNKRKIQERIEQRRAVRNERLTKLTPAIDYTPKVVVNELGDSSVNLMARAWVKVDDYWDVYFDINERIYTELPKSSGISFPFPQMDVHLSTTSNKDK